MHNSQSNRPPKRNCTLQKGNPKARKIEFEKGLTWVVDQDIENDHQTARSMKYFNQYLGRAYRNLSSHLSL